MDYSNNSNLLSTAGDCLTVALSVVVEGNLINPVSIKTGIS